MVVEVAIDIRADPDEVWRAIQIESRTQRVVRATQRMAWFYHQIDDIILVMEDPVPFQVQLERRQHRLLRELAEHRGQSMGSLIRESVATYLASMPVEDDPAFAIIGMFDGDPGELQYGSVAVSHDAYLADAYAAETTRADLPTSPPDR